MRRVWAIIFVLAAISQAPGQRTAPGEALPNLIRGNERFGTKLLERVHSAQPGKNVVVSPLSLTVVFSAIQNSLDDRDGREEFGRVFGWGAYPRLAVPTKMLLAAFEKPDLRPHPPHRARIAGQLFTFPVPPVEGAWITNAVLYRSNDTIANDFVLSGKKYFGLSFTRTGERRPGTSDIRQAKDSGDIPKTSPMNDLVISSGTHLQTAWAGNTFSMSEPYRADFYTLAGTIKRVEVIQSELEMYPYAKSEDFEAVALPCNAGYMLVVLPAEAHSLESLEKKLTEDPQAIDAMLQRREGIVVLPTFHVVFEAQLRKEIEALGIRQGFRDIGNLIKIPKSYISEVNQRVDIRVNRDGILANAEIVAGVVYGGIMAGQKPFRMELNRPFLFFVREQTTNALLFAGAVMDPTQ